jgi:glucosamine-6-phosphate deaminase
LKLEVLADGAAAARRAADLLARDLRRPGRRRLVLASGETMVPVYRALSRRHREGEAPFARAETWNLDELAVAPEDPRSFRTFMERELFSRVSLPRARIHFLRGDAADPDRECRRYERSLAAAGPPTVALLGIGVNGHVAYLEPGRSIPPRTSPVRLAAATRRRLRASGIIPTPTRALTMGIETILSARALLLLATGGAKAAAIAAAIEGPVTGRCPASFLSLHADLTVVLDRAAASRLSTRMKRALSGGARRG